METLKINGKSYEFNNYKELNHITEDLADMLYSTGISNDYQQLYSIIEDLIWDIEHPTYPWAEQLSWMDEPMIIDDKEVWREYTDDDIVHWIIVRTLPESLEYLFKDKLKITSYCYDETTACIEF